MKPLLTTRLCIFALSSLATIGTLIVGGPESSFALDPLPRSPRVGHDRFLLARTNAFLSESFSPIPPATTYTKSG